MASQTSETSAPCPVSSVSSALEPYIRTRLEAQRIRARITAHLHSSAASYARNDSNSVWNDNSVSISQITLGCLPGNKSSTDKDDFLSTPSAKFNLAGAAGNGAYTPESVRRYTSALSNLQRAQAHYASIKAEVAELQQQCNEQTARQSYSAKASGSAEEGSDVKARISTLRLSRERARLSAIGTAVDTLSHMESNPLERDVKSHVKRQVGDVPEPPHISSLSNGEAEGDSAAKNSQLDSLVFDLKKALVAAGQQERKTKEDETRARERCERLLARMEVADVPPRVKVEAMAKARGDLVAWMEGELAKISHAEEEEEEEEEDEEEHEIGEEEGEMTQEEVNAQVQELYQIYVSARRDLLSKLSRLQTFREAASLASTNSPTSTALSSPRKRTVEQQQFQDPAKGPQISAADILPFLPTLMQAARDETALLQQTSHLRKQLNLAASDVQATLMRLAGESHLVPPDTSDTVAWQRAANEFSRKTEEAVSDNVTDGMSRVNGAKEALADMAARRKALEMVKAKLSV
jgi:hypothetical protein